MPVWGTFSVRDHCEQGAFLREVLLFDKLAVPYPSPYLPQERDRWRSPDPNNPSVSWDPDRLDLLLSILGHEDLPGYNGARCAQRVLWDPAMWEETKSRLAAAGRLSGDPYMDTALGVMPGITPYIPSVVEAVAAYRSPDAWRAEVNPSPRRPDDTTAAEALVQLARPYLLPEPGGDELDQLRRVVDMSMDPEYANLRNAYFAWFSGWLGPLRQPDNDLHELALDPASVQDAQQRLRVLWEREKGLVAKADGKRRWTRVEAACISASAVGSAAQAIALAEPDALLKPLGLAVAVLGFAGWAISKWKKDAPPQGLSGASLFVAASQQSPWMQPP